MRNIHVVICAELFTLAILGAVLTAEPAAAKQKPELRSAGLEIPTRPDIKYGPVELAPVEIIIPKPAVAVYSPKKRVCEQHALTRSHLHYANVSTVETKSGKAETVKICYWR